jgi:hypothetical protein
VVWVDEDREREHLLIEDEPLELLPGPTQRDYTPSARQRVAAPKTALRERNPRAGVVVQLAVRRVEHSG